MKGWSKKIGRVVRGTLVPTLLAALMLYPISAVRSEPEHPTGDSFFDDFKSFDQKRWFASNGWSSGNFQSCIYVAANVKIVQGSVELALTQRPVKDRPFSCAEVQTRQGYSFGTYEVKMRGGAAPGTVTAFFTYEGGPHEEIDFELLGKDPKAVQLNYFAADGGKHES